MFKCFIRIECLSVLFELNVLNKLLYRFSDISNATGKLHT